MNKLLISLLLATAGLNAAFAQTEAADSTSAAEVKTVMTLKGAYFNSSCGSDRLGGSKLGYVSDSVLLRVETASETLYKVLLSENRYAYMPKSAVADTTVQEEALKTVASGSMNAFNQGKADRIKIGLPVRKPYLIRENVSPRQLVIELFGVENNSNWVTQYLDLEAVSSIEPVQTDSDVLTLVVNLKGTSSWGYSVKYEKNALVIDVKHAPKFSLNGMTIGIDAGHGGPSSSGAVGRTTKVKEKDLNLSMALMLKELLEAKGAKVVMSRSSDVEVSMTERKEIFLANDIDMMISIHCNAGGGKAHGTSTYYKHIQNRELAKEILDELVKLDGVDLFGLVGNFNFSLNAPTEYPAVLVETLFLSYQPDEELLVNPKFQKQMMKKVAKGIRNYLKECRK